MIQWTEKELTEEEKEYKNLRKQIQEKLIKFALISASGGFARYLNDSLVTGKFLMSNAVARVIIGTFTGTVGGHVVEKLYVGWGLTGAAVCGALGMEAMFWFVSIVKRKFGNFDTPQPKEKEDKQELHCEIIEKDGKD
jgi:hypothetical protein